MDVVVKPDQEQPRQVTVYLVDDAASSVCPFWVGIARPGGQRAGQLLDQPSTGALLTAAAQLGLSEETPLMLADTSAASLRSILLLPPPQRQGATKAPWLASFSNALESWHPPSLGLYLAPEVVPGQDGLDLLGQLLSEVVAHHQAASIYLLTGSYSLNQVLNAALKFKANLPQGKVELHVFH